MGNLNVAVLGAPEYAKGLGKKSTSSDFTFYDVKQGENTVTFAEPTKYPEKLASLFYVASMADTALVVVDAIDHVLGETIVMLDALGLKDGSIILRNYITEDQIKPLLKGTAAEGYSVIHDDLNSIRGAFIERATRIGQAGAANLDAGNGIVPVDHHFDVKGVGAVALATVVRGTIRKHDEVRVLPGDKTAEIRSIQKHDDDSDWGVRGDRVGLALKNIANDDLDRGIVLTNDDGITCSSKLTGTIHLSKYFRTPLKQGTVIHLGHWMQLVPARIDTVEPVDGGLRVALTLEKPLVHGKGESAVATCLEGGKLRVAGKIGIA
jgi:selenocysteine-specific translation elongation factor